MGYSMGYSTIEHEKEAIKLRCPNMSCRHEWNYRGNSKFYASCSFCRTNVHVVRDRVSVGKNEINISNPTEETNPDRVAVQIEAEGEP